jgi:hypothetical protein
MVDLVNYTDNSISDLNAYVEITPKKGDTLRIIEERYFDSDLQEK